ncbi:MAG: hypothetical protein ABIT16_12625 [Croceibacterium sp.]
MASDPVDLWQPAPDASELPPAPLAGTRSQSMQRLQVGLFGLGSMILLVALANVIMTNAKENQAGVVPDAGPTVAAQGTETTSDPLADAGVVPDLVAQPSAEPVQQAPDAGAAPALQP